MANIFCSNKRIKNDIEFIAYITKYDVSKFEGLKFNYHRFRGKDPFRDKHGDVHIATFITTLKQIDTTNFLFGEWRYFEKTKLWKAIYWQGIINNEIYKNTILTDSLIITLQEKFDIDLNEKILLVRDVLEKCPSLESIQGALRGQDEIWFFFTDCSYLTGELVRIWSLVKFDGTAQHESLIRKKAKMRDAVKIEKINSKWLRVTIK